MEFRIGLLNLFALCATIFSQGYTHGISIDAGIQAADQYRVDNWVRNFYDKCGETEVVAAENVDSLCAEIKGQPTESPVIGVGPYCGSEFVKRCVGAPIGCIEKKNCWFAVAMTEVAIYNYTTADSTTTKVPTFQDYARHILSYDIQVLDTCHIRSLPEDETETVSPNKFVGVGLGHFSSPRELDCEKDPTYEDFRIFFFLSDISACNFKPTLPLYPYIEVNTTGGTLPNPTNKFSVDVKQWKVRCRALKQRIPASATPGSKISDFMKYFLLHYYGTKNYTKIGDYTYADVTDYYKQKGNLYFAPNIEHGTSTTTKATPPATDSASSILNYSSYMMSILMIGIGIDFFT